MALIVHPDAVCRVCGCTALDACIDALGNPCSWVEPDLCSACVAEVPTDPMAAADFFDWMDEHGQELEHSLEELEQSDPNVAAAARDLEAATAELLAKSPPGFRLDQIFVPSRPDDDEGPSLEGAPDNAPESSD